jgi:hypothetical protein
VFSYVYDREIDGKSVYIAEKMTGTRTEYLINASLDFDKSYVIAHDGSYAAEYDGTYFSVEDVIIVCKDGKWGSIDYDGNTLVPCVYAYPFDYGEGLAVVTEDIDSGYRYIDRLNNTVFEVNTKIPEKYLADIVEAYDDEYDAGAEYDYGDVLRTLRFHEGLAPYLDGDLYGYIDATGAVVIPARFTSEVCNFAWFSGARAIVRVGARSALIDKLGNEVVPLGDYSIFREWGYSEPVYELRDKNYILLGLVTRDGDPFDGEPVPPSDSGYDYSFTDKAETVRAIFDEFYEYGDYYAVWLGSYGGLADVNGNWVVKVSLLDSLDD